jgi:hypothetical protein
VATLLSRLPGTKEMPDEKPEIIQRIHDAINRSLAAKFEKHRLIQSLQAENLRLRHELAKLKSGSGKTGRGSTSPSVGAVDISK